jgi:hypothetical protein
MPSIEKQLPMSPKTLSRIIPKHPTAGFSFCLRAMRSPFEGAQHINRKEREASFRDSGGFPCPTYCFSG